MRLLAVVLFAAGVAAVSPFTAAQPPGGSGPPRPGEVLPPPVRDALKLTDAQKKQLDALQKDVDARLGKLLTADQRKQLDGFRDGGAGVLPGFPGGFGPPGGFPGFAPAPAARSADDIPPPRVKLRDVPDSAENVRKAVTRSLPVLWAGVDGHTASRGCSTCHNHAVPAVAFATARGRGFDVPEKDFDDLVAFIAGDLEGHRERFLRGQGPGPFPKAGGETDNTGYALFALDVAGYKPDKTTAATVQYTLGRDKARGFWATLAGRAPSEASSFTTTALCVGGVKRFGQDEHKEAVAARTESAREWLLKTRPGDTEDRVFRLIGLKAAGAEAKDVAAAAKDLADTQRGDGGWAQLDALPSDAYATGSALYALHTAGGVPADDPAYRRGLVFLLGTQADDGSWHVKTRSRPFQTYFESGFPYGRDQFISCAATGWATAALALACPPKK
ncbi:MAG: hypothetical protein C0501_17985 [Isosphaera sp.]|nr:hypothetical protein [Isosphaera sp.]